jgi:hypothetical protein
VGGQKLGELVERRALATEKLETLRARLTDAEKLARRKACVYVTGSFGRNEASAHSDLDLFILGQGRGKQKQQNLRDSKLSNLDAICLTARLIEESRRMKFPEFSGDGRWIVDYSEDELIKTLGTQNDDVENTFTARLLLLLESRPLLGRPIYDVILKAVLNVYWKDYDDHKSDFMPAFLGNDILRLWRTFCVNYEATTRSMPEHARAKRRVKNYKLKHSRLLTCYSALLYLLALYKINRTVHPVDALQMIRLTPTERLEYLRQMTELRPAHSSLDRLLSQYESFLGTTNQEETALIGEFMNRSRSSEYMKEATKFGDLMFDALDQIGRGNPFYRLLVV